VSLPRSPWLRPWRVGELLGQLGALARDVAQIAILVARELSKTGSVFFEGRNHSWRQVESVTAIESQPPDVIGLAGIGPVTYAVLYIVFGAGATEGETTVDCHVDFLIVVTESEKRMTGAYSDIAAPIAHSLVSDCQAWHTGVRILPLDFVRFSVPWAPVPIRSIDNVPVFNRFH
jgi:hypothetical protein